MPNLTEQRLIEENARLERDNERLNADLQRLRNAHACDSCGYVTGAFGMDPQTRAKYRRMIDEYIEEPNSIDSEWVRLLADVRKRLT